MTMHRWPVVDAHGSDLLHDDASWIDAAMAATWPYVRPVNI
jgi:hypothetical protein